MKTDGNSGSTRAAARLREGARADAHGRRYDCGILRLPDPLCAATAVADAGDRFQNFGGGDQPRGHGLDRCGSRGGPAGGHALRSPGQKTRNRPGGLSSGGSDAARGDFQRARPTAFLALLAGRFHAWDFRRHGGLHQRRMGGRRGIGDGGLRYRHGPRRVLRQDRGSARRGAFRVALGFRCSRHIECAWRARDLGMAAQRPPLRSGATGTPRADAPCCGI